MDQEIIKQIFELCIIPILAVATGFFVNWLKKKANELKVKTENEVLQKYIDMLTSTVTDCVIATNQTYVEALKKQNAFDINAQKEAFKMTYEAVLSILTEEAKDYLSSAVGDLEIFLTQKIEAEVNYEKTEIITPAE